MAVPVGIPVGAYGAVGYRNQAYGANYFSGASYGAYGGGADERSLDAILGRLAAAEAQSARLRGKLQAAGVGAAYGPQTASQAMSQQAPVPAQLNILEKKCGKCHAPGGNGADSLVLTDESGRLIPGYVDLRAKIVDSVLSGAMPKQGDLTDEELSQLLQFLYSEEN